MRSCRCCRGHRRRLLLGFQALVGMMLGDVLHHVDLLAEATLAELAHKGLLPGVGQNVSLHLK